MTEQDKNYVIDALEYALHKCINVDGNAETHYNTLTNAIEVVKNCSIPNIVWQSEQLVCPDCKLPFTKEELEIKEHCFNCGWEFAN